jgi:hypothetical protein
MRRAVTLGGLDLDNKSHFALPALYLEYVEAAAGTPVPNAESGSRSVTIASSCLATVIVFDTYSQHHRSIVVPYGDTAKVNSFLNI